MRGHLPTPKAIRRTASAIVATAVAFAMLGSSALAAPPVARDHIASTGASAGSYVCAGSVCTATSVLAIVNSPDGPTQACLDIWRYQQIGTSSVPLGYETGCAPLAQTSFSIDTKGLTAASLGPTEIPVQAFSCDSTGCNPTGARTAVVSATFTGVGGLATFRANSKSTFGGCTMYFVGKGSSSEAVATLIVDGRSLDAFASLFTSTQKIKVLCH